MNLQQLREGTRSEHEATEAAMPLMTPGLTLQAYKEVLRVLLPVLRSWESWAEQNAPPALQPLLSTRRRSHWIVEDLAELEDGTPMGDSRRSQPIDWDKVVRGDRGSGAYEVRSEAEFTAAFLGAFYVLEGSSLGGRIIARHLEPAFGFEDGKGNAYFRGHGEATGVLWRETTQAIAGVPEAEAALVIQAAQRTFAAFRSVLHALPPLVTSGLPHG